MAPEQNLFCVIAGRSGYRVLVFARETLHALDSAVPGPGHGRRAGRWMARRWRSSGWEPWLLAIAIGTWSEGSTSYAACQDLEFDRAHGLRSVPAAFGVSAALKISRAMHAITIASLMALPLVTPLPWFYLLGVCGVAAMLAYEQSLVHPDNLSQVKRAFDLNGYVGILHC